MINLDQFPKFKKNGYVYEVVVKLDREEKRSNKLLCIIEYKDDSSFKSLKNVNVNVIHKESYRESEAKDPGFYKTNRYLNSKEYKAYKKIKEIYSKLVDNTM